MARRNGTRSASISSTNSSTKTNSSYLNSFDLERKDSAGDDGIKKLRVSGRGGAGSRPRTLVSGGPHAESPEAPLVPSSGDKLRVSGRGGAGSRPRPLASPNPISEDPEILERPSVQKSGDIREIVKVRVGGRGGAGSRPRSAFTGGPFRDPEPKNKNKKSKTKLTTSTGAPSPFDYLPNQDPIRPTSPLLRFKPSNLSFGQTATAFASSSASNNMLPPIMTTTATSISASPEFQITPDTELRRQRINKLQRTLGEVIPPERIYHGLKKPDLYGAKELPQPPTNASGDLLPSKKQAQTTRAARRSSISVSSLTHLASSVLRPTSALSYTGSLASISTTSMQTSSLESNSTNLTHPSPPPSIHDSCTDDRPMTPLLFSHPVAGPPRKLSPPPFSQADVENAEEQEDECDDAPIIPFSKSSNYAQHSHHIRDHSQVDTWSGSPFANRTVTFDHSIPVWYQPEECSPVVRRERQQGWSGEWNQSDMKEVIAKLRLLK